MSTELFERRVPIKSDRNDKQALLDGNKSSSKTWSTLQVLSLCFVVALTAVVASNIDRIISALSKDDNNASNSPARKAFGHEMYDYFDFNQEDGLNFNWGSFGGYPISVIDQIAELQHEIQQDINFWQVQVRTFLQMDTLQAFAQYMGMYYIFHHAKN